MDAEHTDHPYPPYSRSIYHLSSTPSTSSHSPACSPSHHIFPSFDSTTMTSSFLSPSPSSKLPSLPLLSTATAFTFPHHSSLLPPCPLSPSHSLPLFDASAVSPCSSASSIFLRPSSPLPAASADPYIASILSSPSDYPFPADSTALFSDEMSEALSDGVGDIGCVVFDGTPSSPSCSSPWSHMFDGASGGDCESGSGSGGSDSESRGEGSRSVSDGSSMPMVDERDSQPASDDDDSYSAITPTSPPPHSIESTKRRRKPTTKQEQPTPKPATQKNRKRRLTATAPSPSPAPLDDPTELPEDKRERNKQSASDYRKRRKLYVTSLEQQLSELKAALRVEREEGKKLRGENTVLRASMQMMREFVQGKSTTRTEEKEEEEDDNESAEATKRWETAVTVRVPEEYRPVAPSQKKVEEEQVEEGTTHHTHNTRKRRGRPASTAGKAGGQHKVGLTLFVLFSCFLLYFPWLSDLPSSLVHAPASSGSTGGEASLFYSAAPDCVAQPDLCHRGRTILKLMESEVDMFFDGEHQYAVAAAAAASHVLVEQDEAVMDLEGIATSVVDVKVEQPYTAAEELTVAELAAAVMSPLSLPISAHNASAALAWLGEDEVGIEQLLATMQAAAASPSAFDSRSSSEHDDGGWAAAGNSGVAQQAV